MDIRAEYSRKADVSVKAALDVLVMAKRAVQDKVSRTCSLSRTPVRSPSLQVQGSSSTPWWLVMGVWAIEKGKGADLLDVINSEHPDYSYNSGKE